MVASFDPQGHEWHKLCRGPLAIATYQKSKAAGLVVSEKIFFLIKTYIMLPWHPEFQSDLTTNNMQHFLLSSDDVCVIYTRSIDRLTLEILMLECFPVVSLRRLSTRRAWPNLTPGA